VGQSGHEQAIAGKIDRPQLDVRFDEEAIVVQRHLEESRQLPRAGSRHDGHAEHHKIGIERQ
jgi:hypothetical protein